MNVKKNDGVSEILSNGTSRGDILQVLMEMKEKGRYSEVIRDCLKALRIDPDNIGLRRLLSETYLEVGFVDQAENELSKITLMIDDLMSAYKLRAEIFIQQQRSGEAAEALKIYLAHKPDDPEAINLMGRVKAVEEASVKEIVNPVEDHIESEEDKEIFTELATPTLAEICFNQGEIQEAVNIYEKVLLIDPDDHASDRRLAELRKLIQGEADIQAGKESVIESYKEKMIATLERWLAKVQEMSSV